MNKYEIKRFYRHVGSRIRHRRNELGLSQDDLAKPLKLTRLSICNMEYGRQHTPPHNLVQIGELLGVSVLYFLPE